MRRRRPSEVWEDRKGGRRLWSNVCVCVCGRGGRGPESKPEERQWERSPSLTMTFAASYFRERLTLGSRPAIGSPLSYRLPLTKRPLSVRLFNEFFCPENVNSNSKRNLGWAVHTAPHNIHGWFLVCRKHSQKLQDRFKKSISIVFACVKLFIWLDSKPD